MNRFITSVGGRAPPGQNTPMPCAESRWPDAAHGSSVPAPAEPHAPVLPSENLLTCSLLHPLKRWSLRESRGGSFLGIASMPTTAPSASRAVFADVLRSASGLTSPA